MVDSGRTIKIWEKNLLEIFISIGGVEIALQESLEPIPDEKNFVKCIFQKNAFFGFEQI